MIVRKQHIKDSADEVSMQVSFGLPDVKKALQKYYSSIADICGDDYARSFTQTEPDMRYYFEHDTFANYEPKYREQLSAWCFSMAVRHHLLVPSHDNTYEAIKVYFLSDVLKRRAGRPRKTTDKE